MYPNQNISVDDDDRTVVTDNLSSKRQQICASSVHPKKPSIPITHAVADTGATSVMIMKKTPNMKNVRLATNPLTINLPDGKMVKSTHICDLEIPGLPYVLEGHIVPDLTVASLVGIRILCNLGCTVLFTDTACYVRYQGKVILTGYKDPSTDLWVLPITPDAMKQQKLRTSQGHDLVSAPLRAGPDLARALQFPASMTPQAKIVDVAMFTHSVRTRANSVKFSHQSLCNPKNLQSDESIMQRFFKRVPKYIRRITAKGHMKRPKKGIRSTQKQVKTKGDSNIPSIPVPVAKAAPHPLPIFVEPMPYNGPAYNACREVNYIPDYESIENVFCFGAFADKVSGVVYNDLTGNFPFMSIDGCVCFFVLYHYETNAILVKPIANVDDRSIFAAYKEVFENLEAKGYKPKMDVMDNQATKYIKKFLTEKECDLQLVEPHNHRVHCSVGHHRSRVPTATVG